MSGAPQFPTPGWVGAQPLRPGASAHKAGLSLEQRIAALENGAASRPGPGVVDGSVPVADAAAQGGLAWSAASGSIAYAGETASGGALGTSYGNYLGTAAIALESGRDYKVEYWFDISNGNSGANRTFDIDLKIDGSSTSGAHPRTGMWSDYVAGSSPIYPVSGFDTFTAPDASVDVYLQLRASTGSAVVFQRGAILVTAL